MNSFRIIGVPDNQLQDNWITDNQLPDNWISG
jgi:hypothetical protein